MAHFFAPDRRTDGYDVDGNLAPDSVWRMRILTRQRRVIGLWGGTELTVRSNNPSVVPNDGFGEMSSRPDGLRMLCLLGQSAGTSMLEARMGRNLWCSLQVVVVDVDLTPNPIKDDRDWTKPWELTGIDAPVSGSIPFANGVAMTSVVRIPVPGTNGLAVELRPRGFVPRSGSTSTVFIQDITGKRHLRLDYGYNVKSRTIDYHWNRKGSAKEFWGIQDHTTVGKNTQALYKAGKYLRWGGRILFVVGVTLDIVSIVQASNRLKRATEVVSGWAGAWAGCRVMGQGGAYLGTAIEPGMGTAVGALGGCIIGGAAGYYAASGGAGIVYDWGEETFFSPLPEAPAP